MTLKTMATFIALPLAHIFNLSIEKIVWPVALKSAEVIPIYKAGNKTDITNYRPISLISNIAKIFERIMTCELGRRSRGVARANEIRRDYFRGVLNKYC